MKNELTFKTDKTLRVEEMSDVKVEKERIDGKKPREFYTLMFSDAENPLITQRTRNFFQHHSPDGTEAYWRGANPVDAKAMIGSVIKGEIMKVTVEPYTIIDGTGIERQVNNFTVVIFDGENIPEVVRNYGHILAGQLTTIGMSKTDVGNMPTTDEQLQQSRINSRNARISDHASGRPATTYAELEVENVLEDVNAPHIPKSQSKTDSQKEPQSAPKSMSEKLSQNNDYENVNLI